MGVILLYGSGVVTQTGRIDYEQTPRTQFTVIAVDSGNPALTSTATVRVEVININDHNPQFGRVRTNRNYNSTT